MPLTNAEKQAAWRARRDEELRNLRLEVFELEKQLRNLRQRKLRNPAGETGRKFHIDPAEHKAAAYHEAGHAVVGLATQLPIAYACSVPNGKHRVAHVNQVPGSTFSIGPGYRLIGGRYRKTVGSKAADLDAFGNTSRKIERSAEEHRAEILMCIAGPMAEARVLGDTTWRDKASNSDMRIARFHRGKLGEQAKPWEQYEQEAAALVNKYWPMVEAVAARLMNVDWISGSEVDDICGRVARLQYAKKLRNRTEGNR